LAALVAVVAILLPVGNAAWAGKGPGSNEGVADRGAVRLLTTGPVPVSAANNTAGGLYSFDISWVDQSTQTYYLADRSNVVVDVVDAKTATFVTHLRATPDFRGFQPCSPAAGANDCAGPNGVVAAFPWLFVTDAGSNMVFDTAGNVWNTTGSVTAAPKDVILNVLTGATTDVPGVGAGDEVWFNSGDGNYYATGSGSPLRPLPAATAKGATPLGVIDAEDQNLIQLVPTYNVPAGAGHPAGTAHSVAVNAENNHVFVPLAANNAFPDCLTGCIAVYARPSKVE
jgi:hypothetical protein